MAMDVIDYQIFGDDMQIVEVELDPGETVIAEAGAMNYLEQDIQFETKIIVETGCGMLLDDEPQPTVRRDVLTPRLRRPLEVSLLPILLKPHGIPPPDDGPSSSFPELWRRRCGWWPAGGG